MSNADDLDPWLPRPAPAKAEPSRPSPAQLHRARWLAAGAAVRTRAQRDPASATSAALRLASGQGFVITTRQLRKLGVTEAAERKLVRDGEWSRPRAGTVCVLEPELSVLPEITATSAALVHRGAVISHTSSTALSGLPTLHTPVRPILTRRHRSDAGGRTDILLHSCRCAPTEITTWNGALVTTVARTVVDIARAHGLRAGVVTGDAALYEGLTTPEDLAAAVDAAAGRPGVRTARRVIELVDGRSESPLESLTRLCLVENGFSSVRPQVWIQLDNGRARVDLALVDEGVVIEADGALKYFDDEEHRHVLWEEKLRHEALQRAGWDVVRVSWDEIWQDPLGVVARVHAAIRRQRRLRTASAY